MPIQAANVIETDTQVHMRRRQSSSQEHNFQYVNMQQGQANVEDSRLNAERRLSYKGKALVRFEYFRWNVYIRLNEAKRQPDQQHVERIKRIFRKAGCRQLEERHHIPALVSQQQLDTALGVARRKGQWKAGNLPSNCTTINNQEGYPELDFPNGVECLDGLHRIEAGKQWLSPTEKWWIVDLFLSDVSDELKTILNEGYSNKENPCDGEIYRKIREYHYLPSKVDNQISPATCVSLEEFWWARFNKSREKKLRTLFGKSTQSRMLAASFDALSKIPALFDAGMIVTTLNKVMATKCYEEMCHYNQEYILRSWTGFMKGIENGFQRIDKNTVKTIELRAPGVSTLDARFLQGQVLGGVVFSGFNTQERAIIWENILSFKGIIPSLSKFFQDIHLLQACVDSIRWLATVPPDQTVFTALREVYTQRETQVVQTSEKTFRSESGSRSYCMRLAYLGLFVFVMREYGGLPKAPAGEDLKEIPRAIADREVLRRLASFAYQSGFNTPEIERLKEDLGPPSITDCPKLIPITVTTGPGEDLKRRCGLPRTNTFKGDKEYLYLDNLCREKDETGEGITSFFVLKSWFIAFFGLWPESASRMESPNTPSPALSQHTGEEDVSMREALPGTPNQRGIIQEEQIIEVQDMEKLDTDMEMQETVVQITNKPLIEASGAIQEKEDTLFVPAEPTTQRIRFVCREGKKSESEMFDPFRSYSNERIMQIHHAELASRVVEVVESYLAIHMRVCDKYKKYIPTEECYNVITAADNNNTLFFIPDAEYKRQGQSLEVPERAMKRWTDDEIYQEIEQEQEVEQHQTTDALEELHHEEVVSDADLLDNEIDNAANAHILGRDNTIIYMKKRVGDSHDVSKPAEHWSWVDAQPIHIPIGDPQDIVGRTLRQIWQKAHLKPHDKNLRALEYGDCYRVAVEADDHTLYLMVPSPQTEEERAAERTWIPPLPLSAGVFDFQEKLRRRGAHTTPQAQEDTNFRSSEFVPPSNVRQLPARQDAAKSAEEARQNPPIPLLRQHQMPLVKSLAENHRDKIGRGCTKVEGGCNKVGLSFQEETEGIRKGQVNMRTMEQPTKDQPEGSSPHRKLLKPRNRKMVTTPDREMVEGDSEGDIL